MCQWCRWRCGALVGFFSGQKSPNNGFLKKIEVRNGRLMSRRNLVIEMLEIGPVLVRGNVTCFRLLLLPENSMAKKTGTFYGFHDFVMGEN